MARMTGPACGVMYNLINTHTKNSGVRKGIIHKKTMDRPNSDEENDRKKARTCDN